MFCTVLLVKKASSNADFNGEKTHKPRLWRGWGGASRPPNVCVFHFWGPHQPDIVPKSTRFLSG